MGYQEYVCKIDNIPKFVKKRYKADRYIDNNCFGEVDYSLVEFKQDFENVKKGIYVYVCGDRQFGRRFVGFLINNVIGKSSYIDTIESALGITEFGQRTEYDDKLIDLFKEKSNKFGRVIYEKQPNIQLERSLFDK